MTASLTRSVRLAIAASLASLLTISALAAAASPARSSAGDELLPDLVTMPLDDLRVCTRKSCFVGGKRPRLRFSNTIANQGGGPLEMFSVPADTSSCPQDGDRPTFQTVFLDAAGGQLGVFERDTDTDSDDLEAGCTRYHPNHDHWHFDEFAQYELADAPTGQPMAESIKVSFCVQDGLRPFDELPGSPDDGYYGVGGDPRNSCLNPEAATGLSVGWADRYGSLLAGQAVKVAGLPKGRYCLISTADPANRLRESDEANNSRRQLIRLNPRKRRVKVLDIPCREWA